MANGRPTAVTTEHCLEELRVSAACRGDTSVIPYYWLHGEGQNDTLLGMSIRDDKPLHRCVKWNPLHTWAKSRRVDLRDPNLAVPENESD
jgi:hypothetical protein